MDLNIAIDLELYHMFSNWITCLNDQYIGRMYHIICGSGQCLHDPLALYEAIYIVKQQEVRQEDGKGNDTEDTFELGKGKRIMFDVGYCNQCNVTIVVHGISRMEYDC
eukprot:470011_1